MILKNNFSNLFNKKTILKILFVASEAAPFAKVGGLGEVMHSLPKAIRKLGHDARVLIPKYASIDSEKYALKKEIENIKIESEDKDPYGILVSNILSYEDENGLTTNYFLENMEYYEKRANVYGYLDDTMRWVLLSKGAIEFVRKSQWKPDIIVASDWQTGFIPNLIHTDYKDDNILSNISVVFSIHNLKWQGMFEPKFVSEMDFDNGATPIPHFFDPDIAKLNGMRRGIRYADVINTVSPTYAKEILTEEFGEGLDKILNERKSRLFGILNGIDTQQLNPKTDKELAINYSIETVEKRKDNKIVLQKQFGLPSDKDKFIMGMVSRIDGQKGFDLVTQILEPLLENIDFQFIIIGEGDSGYKAYFEEMKKKYPDKIGIHLSFDSRLPRIFFGGADVVLIPSRFEPSGLVQMEAMRYGCIPIVRKVGGLADSVTDVNLKKSTGTGFVFKDYNPFAFMIAIIRAYELYNQEKEWIKLIKRAMKEDFSWEKSAKEYLKLFEMAFRLHKEDKK